MMKWFAWPLLMCLIFPVCLSGAPGSIYGKALQKARNVTSQAERSRTLPPEKPRPVPAPAVNRFEQAQKLARILFKKKLKSYPASGFTGVNQLLARKIITPAMIGAKKQRVTEKELSIAWFGTQANKANGKEGFPLFITKPAFGEIVVGYTDGTVKRVKSRPRTVTGVIQILRAGAKNKKSSLWAVYLNTARMIDKASK